MSINQGEGKLENLIYKFVQNEDFQKKVLVLRTKLKIPFGGYELKEKDKKEINSSTLFYIPSEMKLNGLSNPLKDLNLGVREICRKFPIVISPVKEIIKNYVLFNELFFETDSIFNLKTQNLCKFCNLEEELAEYAADSEDDFLMANYISMLVNQNKTYPLAIRFHPEASQRVVLNYIKRNWPLIEYEQTKFKMSKIIKNAKASVPKKSQRDKFIYEHRHMMPKQIVKLVYEKFKEDLTHSQVIKIIQVEKKRRNP